MSEKVRVEIDAVVDDDASVVVNYRVVNGLGHAIYLAAGPRMPYVVRSEREGIFLELWNGVPAIGRPEAFDIGLFELPSTQSVEAGSVKVLAAPITKPFGWSSHFSSSVEVVQFDVDQVEAVLVVGYGLVPASSIQIGRLNALFEWQHTAVSSKVTLPCR